MSGSSMEICYLLVIIVTIVFMIWGFVELLSQPKDNEIKTGTVSDKTGKLQDSKDAGYSTGEQYGFTTKGYPVTLAVLSRQLKGFALIMLAQIILVVGMGLCTGIFRPPGMKSSCK